MSEAKSRFITVAIHTYDKALGLRALLENEGIEVMLNNVNLEHPAVSPGVRVRIRETDLPQALRIIENREIFVSPENLPQNGHKILVPVDFSRNSFITVKIAAALADCHKAELVLLHAYTEPYPSVNVQLTDSLSYDIADAEARRQMAETADSQMKKFADEIRHAMKQGDVTAVKFSTVVVEGVPEDAITDYAKFNPPLLTVMGTRGSDKKEKEMIGSVAAEVLDECRFPVLTIPETVNAADGCEIKEIVFFCNLDQEDIIAMDSLARLLDRQQAHITIVAVPGKKRWTEKPRHSSVEALLQYFKIKFARFTFEQIKIDNQYSTEDLSSLNALNKCDLIVVPNKKKNVFSRIFNPSLAHKIIFSTDIPMLVIPV